MDGYTRDRHEKLDYLRVRDAGFNRGWKLFFGTLAPGVNPRTLESTYPEIPPGDRLSALVDRFARGVGSNN